MVESIDKGLPLLKPINFKDDDPINPKYKGNKNVNKKVKKNKRK